MKKDKRVGTPINNTIVIGLLKCNSDSLVSHFSHIILMIKHNILFNLLTRQLKLFSDFNLKKERMLL